MKKTIVLLFAFAAVGLNGVLFAGELRKVWDFNLSEAAGSELGVFSLSFSPDGRRIAAIIGNSVSSESVLVLDVNSPQNKPLRLDVNPGVRRTQSAQWSPSGQQLVLGSTIVDISNQKTCGLPEAGFFFVGPNEVAGKVPNPRRLAFYDLECRRTREWEFGPFLDVDAYDGSAEQGFLLIKRSHEGASLMEVGTQKIRAKLGDPLTTGGWIADAGKTFCVRTSNQAVSCHQIDSGKEVTYKERYIYVDVQAARKSTRIVLSEFGRKFEWGDFVFRPSGIKKRIVWDFESGKILVSWQPKIQDLILYPNQPAEPVSYPFAISPDGEYVVEGGAGSLSLYRIVP